MAMKIASQGSLPSIDLDHIQYLDCHIVVSEDKPYMTSVSGKIKVYGVDPADVEKTRHYKPGRAEDINAPNLDAIVAALPPADQAIAAQAMADVQGGLGVLAQIIKGYTFVQVD